MTSPLFTPLTLRNFEFPNRVWVSPMCQYSAVEGVVGAWHRNHIGALATGAPGLIVVEASAVLPRRSNLDCLPWTLERSAGGCL